MQICWCSPIGSVILTAGAFTVRLPVTMSHRAEFFPTVGTRFKSDRISFSIACFSSFLSSHSTFKMSGTPLNTQNFYRRGNRRQQPSQNPVTPPTSYWSPAPGPARAPSADGDRDTSPFAVCLLHKVVSWSDFNAYHWSLLGAARAHSTHSSCTSTSAAM